MLFLALWIAGRIALIGLTSRKAIPLQNEAYPSLPIAKDPSRAKQDAWLSHPPGRTRTISFANARHSLAPKMALEPILVDDPPSDNQGHSSKASNPMEQSDAGGLAPQEPAPLILSKKTPPLVTASLWVLVRSDSGGASSLAKAALGGSQIGGRVVVPISAGRGRPSLSIRASAAPDFSRSKELGLGLSIQPIARFPIDVIVERRVAVDPDARSATALIITGGLHDRPLGQHWVADGYGQAGIIGSRRTDPVIDGRLSLTRELMPHMRLGLGIWGGAQPKAARLDIGPTLIIPIKTMRVSLDGRIRVVGNAVPQNGLALTIGKDF